ncbi:helix-turn-helix domain-containing protein [Pseudochryseolinea flava]|nr:helix-turn-helix domain-containing protein [Pseudochryseolinea flava]
MDSPMIFQFSRDEFKSLLKETLKEILAEDKISNEDQSTLINIQEAAALLNLAVNTIYEKTSEKLIPHYKHGKKIMFKKSELLAWVESRRVPTIHEIRKEAASIASLRGRR